MVRRFGTSVRAGGKCGRARLLPIQVLRPVISQAFGADFFGAERVNRGLERLFANWKRETHALQENEPQRNGAVCFHISCSFLFHVC